MFHRIIFLLLIVSSLSCNFNRCAVCFQSFMNIACRSTQNAARIKRFLRLHIFIKPLNKKNKRSKFFIMLKRNSFNVHWKFGACQKWEPANRIGDFGNFLNGFAKSPRVRRTVLNIEWRQFVLKNCEILHFVWSLYDKNSASYYFFTGDVMYKKYEMLVYTQPDLLAKFYLSKLVGRKKFGVICFPRIRLPGLIYCDQEPEDDCYFLGVYKRLSTRCKFCFSL